MLTKSQIDKKWELKVKLLTTTIEKVYNNCFDNPVKIDDDHQAKVDFMKAILVELNKYPVVLKNLSIKKMDFSSGTFLNIINQQAEVVFKGISELNPSRFKTLSERMLHDNKFFLLAEFGSEIENFIKASKSKIVVHNDHSEIFSKFRSEYIALLKPIIPVYEGEAFSPSLKKKKKGSVIFLNRKNINPKVLSLTSTFLTSKGLKVFFFSAPPGSGKTSLITSMQKRTDSVYIDLDDYGNWESDNQYAKSLQFFDDEDNIAGWRFEYPSYAKYVTKIGKLILDLIEYASNGKKYVYICGICDLSMFNFIVPLTSQLLIAAMKTDPGDTKKNLGHARVILDIGWRNNLKPIVVTDEESLAYHAKVETINPLSQNVLAAHVKYYMARFRKDVDFVSKGKEK